MFALADCNNFFASCERVFRPELQGRPVIVLSNNDGCAVARSNEAKALGIKMGDPFFKIRHIVEKNDVAVFSGNMALYGDMSQRVRWVLEEFAPAIEVYSIDEAFLDLRGMTGIDYDSYAKKISAECWRQTSIPVSVGIAPSKTLAKIASKLCKRYPKLHGGCYMHRPQDIEKVLRKFPIEDVWGIGRKTAAKLHYMGINTAWDYTQMKEYAVRKMFSLYLSGYGPKAIASMMNREGVRGITGKPLSEQTVGRILRQEKYTGDSLLQKTFTESHITHRKVTNRGEKNRYLVEGTHPPIISKETFEETMAEMERRRNLDSLSSNWKVNTSVFTSKVICSECGRTFRRKSNRREGLPDYCRWVCGEKFDKRNGGCPSKGIPERVLYEIASEIIGKEDFTDEEFDKTIDHVVAGKDHEVTFILRDGTEINRKWRNARWQEK